MLSFGFQYRVAVVLIEAEYTVHDQRLGDNYFVTDNKAAGIIFRFHKKCF